MGLRGPRGLAGEHLERRVSLLKAAQDAHIEHVAAERVAIRARAKRETTVLAAYQHGATLEDIAAALGVSQTVIARLRDRAKRRERER